MSTAGIHATLYQDGLPIGAAMMTGSLIPRIHHSDGVPVYFVIQHPRGIAVTFDDGITRPMLAYPVTWPVPAERAWSKVIHAEHERLPFSAPIPVFDKEYDDDV